MNTVAPVSSAVSSRRSVPSENIARRGASILRKLGLVVDDHRNDMQCLRAGNAAMVIELRGESLSQFGTVDEIYARALEIQSGKMISSVVLAVARDTGLPAEWIAKSNLGANGLASLVSAVKLARELNIDPATWPQVMSASEVISEELFRLQGEKNLRTAERALSAVVDQHVEVASQAATTVKLSGIVPAELVAEIENADPTPTPAVDDELNTAFAATFQLDTISVDDDSDETVIEAPVAQAQRKLSRGAKKAARLAKAQERRTQAQQPVRLTPTQTVIQAYQAQMPVAVVATVVPHVPARITGTIGRPGDRIIGEDGSVHFICTGQRCMKRVSEENAMVSTQAHRIYGAYNVPTNRVVLPSDIIGKSSGHPVFCPDCARKILKGEGDSAKFSELMEKVAKRTDAQLVSNGRAIVQSVLRKPSAAGIPSDALRLIGLWEPGIKERAVEFFADSANQPRPGFVPTMSAQLAIELASSRTYEEWVKLAKSVASAPVAQSTPIETQAQKPVQMEIVSKATGKVETARFGTPDHVFVMSDDVDEASVN